MWPFGKRKEEIRADTDIAAGEIVESDVLLSALLGKTVITKEKALEIPTIQACVNLIAGTISSLPISLYKKSKDDKVEEVRDRRTFLLNNDTGDTLTATQFWKAMIEDYFIGKGGYAYINRDGLDIKSIHYVDEAHISVIKNNDPIFKDYDILVQGQRYRPHQFFKILRKTKDGMQSRSIQEDSPLMIGVTYNAMVYEENMVRKGGNKRGFLKSAGKLSEPAMEALKTAFRRLYSNSEENVVVLNNGIEFQEASNTSVEMQLNENKKANATEMCKLFGIPDAMINGNPTEKDIDNFIRTCMAVMNDIECSLDRDLLLEAEKGTFYWAFDTKELTRGNIRERYEAYKIGLEKNFLQIDEVREKEDLEPIGFDWITLGLDQVLLNPKTGQIYTPNTNALKDMNNMQAAFMEEGRASKIENLIVTGPPGAGKTTWVRENMKAGEIVIDLDSIKCALFGNNDYHAQAEGIVPMLRIIRDALYRGIAQGKNCQKCYVITTECDRKKLENLQKRLNASLKVMDISRDECRKRIENDPSRQDKELFYRLADEWYEKWEGGEKE